MKLPKPFESAMTTEGNLPSSVNPLEQRTSLVEGVVREAYLRFLEPALLEGLTVLAVGGFGRRELFPYSDVDLLLLVASASLAERQRPAIAAFLQDLWDRGLRVSHSVRAPAECCERHEQNLELTISLLDERYLAGDRALYDKLGAGLPRFLHGERQAIRKGLCQMARERHVKAGGSIYQLEPNVKEGPGGLRDLHVVGWLGQLRGAQPDRIPRPVPLPELLAARDFLFALRTQLHERAGRDSNLLTFDLQEEIAEQSGSEAARWMRQFYGYAREIHRAALREIDLAEEKGSNLLVQFREWRSRVSNAEFFVSRERVYFRAPQRLEHEPALALRLFQFVARHGLRPAPETERRLADQMPVLRRYFAAPQSAAWAEFKPLLSSPHCALALRSMHETGMLAAVVPGWQGVDCLVVRDFYHRYTVDEHTLVAIQNLEDLRGAQDPMRRNFAEILEEIDDPALLVLALLFHDLGKVKQDGRHVAESVRLADAAMEHLGVPSEQRREVRLLVERHLEFSLIMTTRDLDDPATLKLLSERAGTIELDKKLAVLTFADVGAVNPSALTPWRMEQLWRVYLGTYNELTRELEEDRLTQAPDRAEFLEGFPVRYLRTHSEAEIAAHLELDQRSRAQGVALDIRKENGFYRLTLVARDRPGLLASIAGALASFGMNILKAEGFANRHGSILDTFVFADPHRTLELNPSEVDRLRMMLQRVTLGKLEVKSLLQNRPKPVLPSRRARIQPVVSFDNQASEAATLIQVVAQDRPGLLYDLASAISSAGCNIDLVLIDTEAHKAIDVFYVTAEARKLEAAAQAALRERLVAACAQ
ncbi:MAG: ACT domain-containing protein [Bryobacteraceae bacterium]